MLNYIDHKNLTESLSEHHLSSNDFTDSELNILTEAIKSNFWTKALSATLMVKINQAAKKVKLKRGTNDKVDSLSDLIKYSAVLINLSIATSERDKSIIRKMN